MELSELSLNRFLYKDPLQNLQTKDAVYDASNIIPVPVPPLASGSAAQDINTSNVFINGGQLEPGTIPPDVLDVSNWGWGQTCVFTSFSGTRVDWTSGVFKSANGVSYAISAGNTGVMAAKTYIYLDLNVSTTAYQITTTPATAVGIGKVLIAVAQNSASGNATFNLSEATQIVGDNILANTINASKITTGQLIVGTNVGIGTAQDSAGVTTIIGNVVTTGFINALNITALGAVVSGSFAIGSNAWHVDTSGNMWWGNYSTYANALAGTSPAFSSAGIFNFLQILNSTNISSYGLNIELTHASNTAAGVQIVQSGAGFGMLQTISNTARGIYIGNSGTGRSIELQSSNTAQISFEINSITQGAAALITVSSGGGNPTGLKLDVSNSAGNGYAFEFAGDIVVGSGFIGIFAQKIRVLIGGSVYYMYLYDS